MAVGTVGIINRIVIDNIVENMRGEAGREIREKFIEQRVMRTEREVTEKFVKAAHGFGAEANLDIRLAVGIRFESCWGKSR